MDARVDQDGDVRIGLALWLRAGRAQRRLTLDDVARITKIQPRILEKLESGHLDGLPAEVFVRGFVKSFARCVGLDETEALDRYGACAKLTTPSARALVETMAELAPVAARRTIPSPVIEVVELPPAPVEAAVEAAPADELPAKKKRAPRKKSTTATPRTRKKKSTEGLEVAPILAEGSVPITVDDVPVEIWRPTMPPISTTPSVPWRRPTFVPPRLSDPRLVIDDADPERADRERADRDAEHEPRRSFLPPILLDREDRSARQGGLTLAVIILLIAATLTLSYLMRRPTVSGDGVTMRDVPSNVA